MWKRQLAIIEFAPPQNRKQKENKWKKVLHILLLSCEFVGDAVIV